MKPYKNSGLTISLIRYIIQLLKKENSGFEIGYGSTGLQCACRTVHRFLRLRLAKARLRRDETERRIKEFRGF